MTLGRIGSNATQNPTLPFNFRARLARSLNGPRPAMRFPLKFVLPIALIAAVPAFAQNAPPASENAPPARVGRVAFVSGNVAVYQLGQSDWSKAVVNLPAASGDWFATDKESRAELRIGPDSIDLANDTELNIADLRETVMQIAMAHGRIDMHVRQLAKGESDEIDIPVGGVWMLEPGIYDVAVGTNGQPTRIAVFEGSARFAGGSVDKTIKVGETLVLNGSGANLVATIEKAASDQFANWCRSRDYQQAKLAAPYHVSSRMTGYEELDNYGHWETVRDYGEVWYPSGVPVGWLPYRDGYWDWSTPWGWSWVDYQPWGFAPFHYGRWAYINGLWGWAPGAYVADPVYAPALVGWIGDPGATLAGGFNGPAVGWFPLGPGEAYYPSYTTNSGYLRAVNAGVVTNAATLGATLNAQGQFANRRFATVVPQQILTSGASVRNAALAVSDPAVQRAAVAARPNVAQPAFAAAARGAARAPGAPNFSRLSGPAGRLAANAAAQGTNAAPQGARGGPPGQPNFAHLAPTPRGGAAVAGNAAVGGLRGINAGRPGTAAAAIRSAQGARFAGSRAAAAGPARFAGSRAAAAGPARFAGSRAAPRGFA